MSTPRTATQIVAAHYAAGARGDLAGMLADLHPQVRWTEAAGFPCAGTYTGPDSVAQNVFAVIAAQWSDFGFMPSELLAAGDTVVALGDYRGRHRASGAALQARTAHVWRVRDGLIVAFEQFTDTAVVAQAAAGKERP